MCSQMKHVELPLEMEISFAIDLILGTSLMSLLPFWTALVEAKELKEQLQDLVD